MSNLEKIRDRALEKGLATENLDEIEKAASACKSTSEAALAEAELKSKISKNHRWEEARQWLTDRGYDKLYGARPMGRLVQEKIKQPLAEELLFGKLVNGGEVKVRIKDNAPAFEIVPAAPKPSKIKPKAAAKKTAGGKAPAAE